MKFILSAVGLLALAACGEGGAEADSSDVVSRSGRASRTVTATGLGPVELARIWNVRNLDLGPDDPKARLIETSYDDPTVPASGNIPEINRTRLDLIVNSDPVHDADGMLVLPRVKMFPLILVGRVERADRTAANAIELSVLFEDRDDNLSVVQQSAEASLTLGAGSVVLSSDAVEGGSLEVDATEAKGFGEIASWVERVDTVRFAADGGEIVARVYSLGGSAARMVYLHLMQASTNHLLDLGIRSPLGKVVGYPSEGKLEIELTDDDGNTSYHMIEIQQKNGKLQPSVKVTKSDAAG